MYIAKHDMLRQIIDPYKNLFDIIQVVDPKT